jgi:peptide-methionine (S)-S-oxide reductase
MRFLPFALLITFFFSACQEPASQNMPERTADPLPDYNSLPSTPSLTEAGFDTRFADFEKAYFASGCFWCTEEVFERVRGVEAVYSGYTGGEKVNPTYQEVGAGLTNHAEAVVVYYDPAVVSYELLLKFFYASHDPTQVNRQGPDVGRQYRSGVYYLNEQQRELATAYQAELDASGKYNKPIATEIAPAGAFYLAEAYHQDYYPNHPENPYVQRVSRPKVEKFTREFPDYLKEGF